MGFILRRYAIHLSGSFLQLSDSVAYPAQNSRGEVPPEKSPDRNRQEITFSEL
jgi:hypothetical protein